MTTDEKKQLAEWLDIALMGDGSYKPCEKCWFQYFDPESPDIVLKCLEKLTENMGEDGIVIDRHAKTNEFCLFTLYFDDRNDWFGKGKAVSQAILSAALEASRGD